MHDWQVRNAFGLSNRGKPYEPRTDSQRTDVIMDILARDGLSDREAEERPGYLASSQASFTGLQFLNDGISVAIPSANGMVLQVGQVGVAILQALGTAALVVLMGILKSFQDRLGRLPNPQETENALRERQGIPPASGVQRKGVKPAPGGEKPDCERENADDRAICAKILEDHPEEREAAKVCYNTAAVRYSECLAGGLLGIRTPLFRPRYR